MRKSTVRAKSLRHADRLVPVGALNLAAPAGGQVAVAARRFCGATVLGAAYARVFVGGEAVVVGTGRGLDVAETGPRIRATGSRRGTRVVLGGGLSTHVIYNAAF